MTGLPPATPRTRIDLPLRRGDGFSTVARVVTFDGLVDGAEHLALGLGRAGCDPPLVRLHSECLTGDVLGSERCDCGPQLDEAVRRISNAGGYLLYLRQEGRGIGLYAKLDAYTLQDTGLDTYDANVALGYAADGRTYAAAAQMLLALGAHEVDLLTNNPDKALQLESHGVRVRQRVPTAVHLSPANAPYLAAKARRGGHDLAHLRQAPAGASNGQRNPVSTRPARPRLGAVHRAGGPAPDTVNVAAWARDALAQMSSLPGVGRVGLALVEGGGRRLRFTASDRAGDGAVEWCHVDAYDDVPLNTAVRTGRPVLGGLDDLRESYGWFVERQRGTATVALAAVPIVTAGQTLGGFVLFFDRPQAFADGQQLELARVGGDLGAALRRAQRAEARPHHDLSDQPTPPGALSAVRDVPADPAAVAETRRFLRRTLGEWGIDEETTDTAVLCLSELVTNALIHTQAGCAVRVLLDQGILTTSVRDSGTREATAVEATDDPFQVHGRGLLLVDALATRWGSDLDSVGTTVWFVLEP